jgi:hypothetical protein
MAENDFDDLLIPDGTDRENGGVCPPSAVGAGFDRGRRWISRTGRPAQALRIFSTTSAICRQYRVVFFCEGPSTMTRHMFWVPE